MAVMTQLAIDFSAPVRPRVSAKGRALTGPSSIEGKAGRDLPTEVYTRDEVQRLLDGPLGRNAKTRTRNRALLVVMWRAGLRVSEALDLRMDDLRPGEGGVWVRRGKGGKPRFAGMDSESFEALGSWLGLRTKLGLGPGGPVFLYLHRQCGAAELRAPHVPAAAIEAGAVEAGARARSAAHACT